MVKTPTLAEVTVLAPGEQRIIGADEFVVVERHDDGHTGLAPDADGLSDRFQDGLPLSPDVGGVQPMVARDNLAQSDDLVGASKAARWINQAGRQSEGTGLHRFSQQLFHAVKFGRRWLAIVKAHDGDA